MLDFSYIVIELMAIAVITLVIIYIIVSIKQIRRK